MGPGHLGDMTAKITDTREEMIDRITDMGQIKWLLLIKTSQMPAIASVRRVAALSGGKSMTERSNGVIRRSHGKIGRSTRMR